MALPEGAPTRINGYELLDLLGQGGMGIVYRARQLSIGRDVALKVLSHKLARDQASAARLLQEARAAALLDHPNIVRAIDVGEAEGYHYFAMELVEGKSLAQLLAGFGPLPLDQALDITGQIATALRYADAHRMIHLDLKPSNILLAADGSAKLADFGLARRISEQAGSTSEGKLVFGTPRYMSPEHLTKQATLDSRSDIYSLGVTLYEMLCGVPAFGAETIRDTARNVKAGDLVPLEQRVAGMPADVCAAVGKMMARRPEQRYANADQLLADLGALRSGLPPAYALARVPLRERDLTQASEAGGLWRKAIVVASLAAMWLALIGYVVAPRVRDEALRRVAPPQRPAPGELRDREEYEATLAYRRALLNVRALAAAKRFGEGMETWDDFLKRSGSAGTPWDELHSQAEERRKELLKEGDNQVARATAQVMDELRRRNWTGARELAAVVKDLGVPAAEKESQRLLALVAREESLWRQQALQDAAHKAFAELNLTLDKLRGDGQYYEALAACDRFLTADEYGDYHPQARGLREPLAMRCEVLDAARAGAQASVGAEPAALGGKLVAVRGEAVSLDKSGKQRWVRLRDLNADALGWLALAGGASEGARLRTGLALLALDAGKFADAYNQVHLARNAEHGQYAALLDDVEARSLLEIAQANARGGQWKSCADFLAVLKQRHERSPFYQSHAALIADLQAKATHGVRLASGMVFIEGAEFLFHHRDKTLVESFYVDTREVSVGEYAAFLQEIARSKDHRQCHPEEGADKSHEPLNWPEQLKEPERPVVGVDWFDAYAFAAWSGKGLPTEAEWELAAQGAKPRRYSWGDAWDSARANSAAGRGVESAGELVRVDALAGGASPYGCLNLSGNAREWTSSRPAGSRTLYVVKGGSFEDPPEELVVTNRWLVARQAADMNTGFRCCIGAQLKAGAEPDERGK